jgi:hypothetical protein
MAAFRDKYLQSSWFRIVIASEAKQSSVNGTDFWIASSLRSSQ